MKLTYKDLDTLSKKISTEEATLKLESLLFKRKFHELHIKHLYYIENISRFNLFNVGARSLFIENIIEYSRSVSLLSFFVYYLLLFFALAEILFFYEDGSSFLIGIIFVLSLLMCEVILRVNAFFRHGGADKGRAYCPIRPINPWHICNDRVPFRFDAIRGYDWQPEQEFVSAILSGTRFLYKSQKMADKNGNLGSPDTDWTETGKNILVLGDSYTAYDGAADTSPSGARDVEWPHFLKSHLQISGLRDVRVQNWARTGHGVLQMIDTAADVVRNTHSNKIDIVIICYIDIDISRARFYLKTQGKGLSERAYKSLIGDNHRADPKVDVEYRCIDRDLTAEIVDSAIYSGESGRIGKSLFKKYVTSISKSSFLTYSFNLFNNKTSFLFSSIISGSYFFEPIFSTGPYIKKHSGDDDYSGDERLQQSIKVLRESRIPVVFVRLPYSDDGTQHILQDADPARERFVVDALDAQRIEFKDSFIRQLSRFGGYSRSEFDSHPSLPAKMLIGKVVADELSKRYAEELRM
ncbi:MAG: hypothetical protein NXI18_17330 [Alphaproteobacteria bacterium]|nr:hypothetical protein [Alphaproteobacteria bacterium]